ncbi:MAG: serine hydrolase domain-containing protein [Planctomycetota bacterium]
MLLLALALALSQEAEPRSIADLGPLVETVLAAHDVPALWAATVDLDGLTGSGARGVRRRGTTRAVGLDDRLHLGSCTKSMTAALAVILSEEGQVTLGDSIADPFPDFDVHAAWRPVTLRHLLAHRGGAPANLVDYAPLGLFIAKHDGEPPTHRRTLARALLQSPPKHAPGEDFVYSNDGYALVAAALEARTGRAWRELLAAELFAPVGIVTFGFGPPDAFEDQPVGHTAAGEPAPLVDNPAAYGPAGRVHLPLEEWARYVAWNLCGARDGAAPLSKRDFEALHVPALGGSYAAGWLRLERPWSKGHVLHHNGSNTVWMCAMWLAPAEGVAYIAATNQGGDAAGIAVDQMIAALIRSAGATGSR